MPYSTLSCKPSGKAIAILRACRAHWLARWHRFVSIEHRKPLQTALQGTFARAMICWKIAELPRTAVSALFHPFPQIIWHGNRLSRGLQGTSARALICRKNPNLPRTAVSALFHAFLQFIWHGNRHSTGLQGISARAMASICVHRAPRTPPDSTPGHICSRGDLQEEPQPATHSRQCPIPRFPANNLARQSPF